MRRCGIAVGLCLLLVAGAGPAAAQRVQGSGQDTPRAAMRGYLEACRVGDYEAAARLLDLRDDDAKNGPALARRLKVVLDRTLWVDLQTLSAQPGGKPDDGLPQGVDLAGTIDEAEPAVDVLLRRGADGSWRIDAATVGQIGALYDQFGFGWLGDWLPEVFFEVRLLEMELWQWVGLILFLGLAYLLGRLVTAFGLGAAARLAARTESRVDDLILRAVAPPLTATLSVGIFYLLAMFLRLSVPALARLAELCQALALVGFTWLVLRVTDIVAQMLEARMTERGDAAAATIVPMGRRITKVFLLAIATLTALQNMGYNITGLIAGLGIGGLAVALAAQKTFENFLGGLSVIADRPIQVGQFGRVGSWIGTVEEIGLRSTRIRTLDRTVVTIPNGEFSSLHIESFAERDRIRFFTMIGVRYETSAEQLRHLLIELKRLLVSHSRVLPDPARVRFVGFGAFSLDLEIFCYVDTADWNEFLAIREDLMLRIIAVVEASGTGFAFPSQTLYLGRDDGLDAEATRAAEERVRAWREGRELELPVLPERRAAELRGTIPYPPEGSAS